jgi:hypothetical protein
LSNRYIVNPEPLTSRGSSSPAAEERRETHFSLTSVGASAGAVSPAFSSALFDRAVPDTSVASLAFPPSLSRACSWPAGAAVPAVVAPQADSVIAPTANRTVTGQTCLRSMGFSEWVRRAGEFGVRLVHAPGGPSVHAGPVEIGKFPVREARPRARR